MRIEDNVRIPKPVAGLLGFLLTFNFYLMPWSAQSPRATDLVGLVFLALVMILLLMGLRVSRRLAVRVFITGILLIPMFWHGLLIGGIAPIVDAVRWVIGFGWALSLTWVARENALRRTVFKGVILGTVGGVGVVVLQAVGELDLTMSLGLAAQDAVTGRFFRSVWRVPGMEPNVNGSAAVLSLAVPVALGLVDENRGKLSWLFVALGVVLLGSALTFNRSSILVTGCTVTAWVFLSGNQAIGTGWKITVVFLLALGLITYGPPGGWERWQVFENLSQSSNFQVRYRTTIAALETALHNPLGLGKVYQQYIESQVPGQDSTHNAFLQLILMGGLPIALWVLWKLILHALSLTRRGGIEGWLSLHMLGLFFFEEYFAIPTIITVVVWITVYPFTEKYLSENRLIRRSVSSIH